MPEYVANPADTRAVRRLKYVGRSVFWFYFFCTAAGLAGLGWLIVQLIPRRPDTSLSIVEGDNLLYSAVWLCIIIALAFTVDWMMTATKWAIRLLQRRFVKQGAILKVDPRVEALYTKHYHENGIWPDREVLYSLQLRIEATLRDLRAQKEQGVA